MYEESNYIYIWEKNESKKGKKERMATKRQENLVTKNKNTKTK